MGSLTAARRRIIGLAVLNQKTTRPSYFGLVFLACVVTFADPLRRREYCRAAPRPSWLAVKGALPLLPPYHLIHAIYYV
jgi:predicted naringenin-chalcone synthase